MSTCAPGISVVTMAAIVQQESAFNPYSIHVNGGSYTMSRQPKTRAEALNVVRRLSEKNQTNLDVGLAQINTSNLKIYGVSVAKALDPCTNLKVGAAILSANYRRAHRKYGPGQKALWAAISAYNTGNFIAGFKNGYVQKVIRHSRRLAVRLRK